MTDTGALDPAILQTLVDRAPQGIVITDAAGRVVWVNARFVEMTGYPLDALRGAPPGARLQGPETDPAAVAEMRRAQAAGRGFRVEVLNYHRHGHPYWVDIACAPLRRAGKLTHFVAFESDITVQKTQEADLLHAEEVAGLGRWRLRLADEALETSAGARRVLGLGPEAAPRHLSEVLERHHPDDRPAIRLALSEASASGAPLSFRSRVLVAGEYRWMDVRGACVRGPDGRLVRYAGTVQDVHDLVSATWGQRAQQDRFRALADTLPGVAYQWVASPDGTQGFTYVSQDAEAALGIPAAELLADWTRFAVDPRDAAAFEASIQAALVSGDDWSFTGRRVGPGGEERWFKAAGKCMDDAAGALVYNGIILDVTAEHRRQRDLERALEAAADADRAKSLFLATMSHELRTPLNAISGFADMMAHEIFGPLGDPRYRDYLADIHRSAGYLRDLIDSVLDLSAVESGRLELREEALEVARVFAEVEVLFRQRAHQADIRLEVAAPGGLRVRGDARALRQILINCVDNALKHTPAGGRVALGAVPGAGRVVLSVADTGKGIDPEEIPRLTQPFYQGDVTGDAMTARGSGVGIGLALVQRFVAAMGGELGIESALGASTRVEVTLPAA